MVHLTKAFKTYKMPQIFLEPGLKDCSGAIFNIFLLFSLVHQELIKHQKRSNLTASGRHGGASFLMAEKVTQVFRNL